MTSISPLTASAEGPDTVGFRSSGTSPGVQSLHLVGPGQVGRRFLQLLHGRPLRLVAVSDSTATLFERSGLDPAVIERHKASGRSLCELPRAELIPTELALGVIGADIVVDATSSNLADTPAALARGRAALRNGAALALCGKNGIAAAAAEWLLGQKRGRVGINGVLGGAGRQLARELSELRGRCDEVAFCGNVTTTVILQAIERGADVAAGIEHARALGLLEPDPTLDLDGSDAAVKLATVCGAVFGDLATAAPDLQQIAREDVRSLDVALVRARAQRGATTRLVARARRSGGLAVRFEEVNHSSPLAAPPDRVVYTYRLGSETRVHTGLGVGYEQTAAAILADVLTFAEAR